MLRKRATVARLTEGAAVAFELWETRSGNLMGSYETEDLALAAVSEALDSHGADYIDTVALVREGPRGRSKTIATGAKLAARARAADRRAVSA